jgi:outer membrane protein assembly factor BamD
MFKKALYLLLIINILLLLGCAHKKPSVLSSSEYFRRAKSKFLEEDYLDSITLLEEFIRLHSGSRYIEEAQFLLAEAYFEREQYLMAATEYRYLIQRYPNSDFVETAQYKVGLCYFELSPKPVLDQTYTEKAIKEFNKYIVTYGSDGEYIDEAKRKHEICRNKFAEKAYKNGYIYYRSLKHFEAARKYYQKVLDEFRDTPWADDAVFGIAQTYFERKQWDQAIEYFERLLNEYPETTLAEEATEKLLVAKENKNFVPESVPPKEEKTENPLLDGDTDISE